MRTSTKVSFIALGLLCVAGFATMDVYHHSVALSQQAAQRLANEAIVFDVAWPSYFRMSESQSENDLQVQSIPQFKALKPGDSYRGLVSYLPSTPDLSKQVDFSLSMKDQHVNKVKQMADTLFTSDGLYVRHMNQMLNKTVSSNDSPRGFTVDAGINHVTWKSLNVNIFTGAVNLSGQGEAWACEASWVNGSYKEVTPRNIINFTVTFKKVNGEWKVDQLSHSFVSGSGP